MMEREVRPNEVRVLTSRDGRLVVAICQRADRLFSIFEDYLEYVEESEADFWQRGFGEPGLYGSADDAEREVLVRYPDLVPSS